MGAFSEEEKKKYLMKKHIKNHLFEYVLDIIAPILCTIVILYFCEERNYLYGIIISFFYSLGRTIYRLRCYKKDFIDI